MSQVCLYIPIKPISYNQSHVVVGQVLRSSTISTDFKRKANKLITPFSGDLKRFSTKYIDQPIKMDFRYIFWLPGNELITKAGAISKTSMDVDNQLGGSIKIIQDLLFKRMTRWNENINDAFITKIIMEKKASPKNEHGITIYAQSELLQRTTK